MILNFLASILDYLSCSLFPCFGKRLKFIFVLSLFWILGLNPSSLVPQSMILSTMVDWNCPSEITKSFFNTGRGRGGDGVG